MVFVLICAGCGTVSRVDPKLAEEFSRVIIENRKAYDKIALPFLDYANNDVFVDEVVQADYMLAVTVWGAWLERSEKFVIWLRSQGLIK